MTIARVERRSRLLASVAPREDGQSLVEFAVTLPLLLLLVTGITAFGIAINNYIMLTEATAVGARQLTSSRGQTLDPCQTFSISLNGTSYTGTSCSGTSTTGAPSNMILGTNAVVTVTYPFSLNLYGINVVPSGSLLVAKTTELMQ